MPGITPIYDPNDKNHKALYESELAARKETIDRAWRYYEGKHDRNLAVGPKFEDYNVVINVSGQAIDKMVWFFSPDTPKIFVDNDDRLNAAINDLLDANDFSVAVRDIVQAGFVAGHTFIRLLPQEGQFAEMSLIDARNVTVFWNASHHKQLLYYRLTWSIDARTDVVQDIVPIWLLENKNMISPKADYSLGWRVFQYTRKANGKLVEDATEDWEYPFAPIVDWKNNPSAHEYYGLSDLRHIALNDTLNFVAGNMNKIIFHHGGPQTVITGGQVSDVDILNVGHGRILQFTDPNVKVFNLEMKGDLEHSLRLMDVLRASFFAQMKVVDLAMIRDKLARVTNFGVRMIYSDMLDMNTAKRRVYGRGLTDLVRYALELSGIDALDSAFMVQFADPLPDDRLTEAEALEIEQRLGVVSQQTIAEDLGRDYGKEIARKQNEPRLPVGDMPTTNTGVRVTTPVSEGLR